MTNIRSYKKKISFSEHSAALQSLLSSHQLHTVCRSARCPNQHECWARGTMTFMILGAVCTRDCTFCAVDKGRPQPVDHDEPQRIAAVVKQQKMSHTVITSVTRDDLPDGGAGQYAQTIRAINNAVPETTVEVLIPDLAGSQPALQEIVQAGPEVVNHNLETVPQLYAGVRPQADYRRSLQILAHAKALDASLITKSGIMVGLGETKEMVREVMRDLRQTACDVLTIGQYFQPKKECRTVTRYIEDEEFREYTALGLRMGFAYVAAGRFVRSSYQAGEIYNSIQKQNQGRILQCEQSTEK